MSDDQVIEARLNMGKQSCLFYAKKFSVNYKTMWAAVKGLTFKHLNLTCPPQL